MVDKIRRGSMYVTQESGQRRTSVYVNRKHAGWGYADQGAIHTGGLHESVVCILSFKNTNPERPERYAVLTCQPYYRLKRHISLIRKAVEAHNEIAEAKREFALIFSNMDECNRIEVKELKNDIRKLFPEISINELKYRGILDLVGYDIGNNEYFIECVL